MKTIGEFTIFIGLALASCTVFAQAPAAEHEAAPEAAAQSATTQDQQPAPDRPTKEQLNRLFEVMHLKDQMQSMMTMMPALIEQQMKEQEKQVTSKVAGGTIKPEQQEEISKITSKYMEKALSVYTIDQMLDDMATIYQRHLSRSDVDAFIAFYGSDAGQHLLNLTPVMMQEYMPMAMKRVQDATKSLTDDMTKEIEECVNTEPTKPDPSSKDKPAQK